MSEETKITAPQGQFEEVVEQNVPVLETTEEIIENNQNEEEVSLISEEILHDLANKSLKEIITLFESLVGKGDQQEMYKYAEPIKAIFYKTLKKEKIAAGFLAPTEDAVVEEELEDKVSENPFAEIERGFKEIYAQYKSLRTAHLQQVEKQKDENLEVKKQIIEDLKTLVETQEDITTTFPQFRSLQTRWRESGPVPQAKVKDIYDSYQHYVEMFYDYVKINNELRDLDFKKNLEAKTALCEKAEALVNDENVVNAFTVLQKLHEEWKEFGPVEKEYREAIWERFKVATSQVNKKHQAYFEKIKADQKVNLAAKAVLCEKAEEIAAREVTESNVWNEVVA